MVNHSFEADSDDEDIVDEEDQFDEDEAFSVQKDVEIPKYHVSEELDKKYHQEWQARPVVDFNLLNERVVFSPFDFQYDVTRHGTRVHAFGTTSENYSICCTIVGHLPNFGASIPDWWSDDDVEEFYYLFLEKMRSSLVYKLGHKHYKQRKPFSQEEDALMECFGDRIERQDEFYVASNAESTPKEREIDVFDHFEVIYDREFREFRGFEKTRFMWIYTKFPSVPFTADRVLSQCMGGEFESFVTKTFYTKKRWLPETLGDTAPEIFECDLEYATRMRIDTGIVPEKWYVCKRNAFAYTLEKNRYSKCQLEIIVYHSRIETPGAEDFGIPHRSFIFFDIETNLSVRKKNNSDEYELSNPQIDPILIICQTYAETRDGVDPVKRLQTSFSLGDYDMSILPKEGVYRSYTWDDTPEGEIRMLLAWLMFIQLQDADFIGSFNGENFDVWYVLERCKFLGIPLFLNRLTRRMGYVPSWKESTFRSKGRGSELKILSILPGRLQYDYLRIILMDHRTLRSYSLNAVCLIFLEMQKDDISYKLIPEYRKTRAGRSILVKYCFKDANLVMWLENKLQKFLRYSGLSILSWTTGLALFTKGVQSPITTLLHVRARKSGRRIPRHLGAPKVPIGGGLVTEPEPGYYTEEEPIATHDFNSLYPSIMQQQNLSYETVIGDGVIERLNLKRGHWFDFEKQLPHEERLWKPSDIDPQTGKNSLTRWIERIKLIEERDGIDYYIAMDWIESGTGYDYKFEFIPGKKCAPFLAFRHCVGEMVGFQVDALDIRNYEKKQMAKYSEDDIRYMVHDANQAGTKVLMNSGYGYMQAFRMPDSRISACITHTGQGMNKYARYMSQKYIRIENGFACNLLNIAGDTDSNMNKYPGVTHEQAEQMCIALQKESSKWFLPPHILGYEKLMCPALMMDVKKKYAYQKRLPGKPFQTKISITGMACVRRENTLLLINTMEKFLDDILLRSNPNLAINNLIQTVIDFKKGDIPYDHFFMTRKMTKAVNEYSNPDGVMLINLVQRMIERGDNDVPKPGTRYAFVIVKPLGKKVKVSSRAETTEFAWNNDLPLDLDYYFEKQLYGPMKEILKVMKIPEDEIQFIFYGPHSIVPKVERMAPTVHLSKMGKRKNDARQPSITTMFRIERRCKECKQPVKGDRMFCEVCQQNKALREEFVRKCQVNTVKLAFQKRDQLKICSKCRSTEYNVVDIEEAFECGAKECTGNWLHKKIYRNAHRLKEDELLFSNK